MRKSPERATVRQRACGLAALVVCLTATAAANGGPHHAFCEFGMYAQWSDLSYEGERLVLPALYGRRDRIVRNGHSIDRLDGFVLWVDTADFYAQRLGRALTLPSGERRPARGIGAPKDGWLEMFVGTSRSPAEVARVSAALYAHSPEMPAPEAANAPPLASHNLVARPDGLIEVARREVTPAGTLISMLDDRAGIAPGREARRGWAASAVYFHRAVDGTVDVSVTCETKNADLNFEATDMCVQTFETGPFSVELSYDLDELPNWRRFRQAAGRLIDCARGMGSEAGPAREPPGTPLSPIRRRDGDGGTPDAPRPFCDVPGRYARWSDMTLAGVRLVVPTAYELLERPDRDGREVTGFIGSATMPSFRPTLSRADRPADHTQIGFLILEQGKNATTDQIARLRASRMTPEGRLPYRQSPPITRWRMVPGPAGLTEMAATGTIDEQVARFPRHGNLDAQYVHRGADGLADVTIECGFGSSPLNSCKQNFEIEPFRVSMSYRRDMLPYWREFQAGMERFVDCARTLGHDAPPTQG